MKKKILEFIKLTKAVLVPFTTPGSKVYHFKDCDIDFNLITDGKVAVVVQPYQLEAYQQPDRTYIQDIFPELTGMERQFIQSGYFFGKFDGKSFEKAYQQINSANEIIRILP